MIDLRQFLFEADDNINNFQSVSRLVNDLRKTNDFTKIKELVVDRYQIGDGTTRDVYDLGKDKVLKLAKYPDDNTSNLKEVESYQCLGKEYAAQILDFDSENYLLVSYGESKDYNTKGVSIKVNRAYRISINSRGDSIQV